MEQAFTLTIENGIATLLFDCPGEKINKFSTPVMAELEEKLQAISKNSEIQILVIKSANKGIFIAGADIMELAAIQTESESEDKAGRGQEVFKLCANLNIPTVAVIAGACRGGGTVLGWSW